MEIDDSYIKRYGEAIIMDGCIIIDGIIDDDDVGMYVNDMIMMMV